MTRASTPLSLLQLQNADSLSSQAALLRSLKNETIGHDQRKVIYVKRGIIPILTKVLTAGKLHGRNNVATELNGAVNQPSAVKSDGDEACHQAIIILGSLAQGK